MYPYIYIYIYFYIYIYIYIYISIYRAYPEFIHMDVDIETYIDEDRYKGFISLSTFICVCLYLHIYE